MNEQIIALRTGKLEPRKGADIEWRKIRGLIKVTTVRGPSLLIEEPPPECPPTFTNSVNPLMPSITWSQGCYYNELLPACAECSQCQRLWAGCGPIAIAQVMKYWQHPTIHPWASMPDALYSSHLPTANAITNVFLLSGVITFGNAGTAMPEGNIPNTFRQMGYSSARIVSYDGSIDPLVRNNLNANRPVIFTGWVNIFNAHIWVCDGYRYYLASCGYEALYYHMNWGWGGYANGMYLNSNWNSPQGNYSNMWRNAVIDIYP